MISSLAEIDSSAKIGNNVSIGAFSVIGPNVEIGDNCEILTNAVVKGPTKIGKNNRIFQFASIGEEPQDLKYHGEMSTLEIGDNNTFRECCTVHRGTESGGGVTKIGDNNLIMNYVHIGHDSVVGNNVILVNGTALAGHVIIEDNVILGGATLVRQFLHIGTHAFSAMGSVINKDVPPFVLVNGHMAVPKSINSEGLRRNNFTDDEIKIIKKSYKILYKSGLMLEDAIESMSSFNDKNINKIIKFIADSRTRKSSIVR